LKIYDLGRVIVAGGLLGLLESRQLMASRKPDSSDIKAITWLKGDVALTQDSKTKRPVKLGEGAFARVCSGKYKGQDCAVKIFHSTGNEKNRIEMECKISLTLCHKNIVKTFGLWQPNDRSIKSPTIVMERCDETLSDYLLRQRNGLLQENKLKILFDIVNAMIYMHNTMKYVHGDLRVANILIFHQIDGKSHILTAKVADMGLAGKLDTTGRFRASLHTLPTRNIYPPEVYDYSRDMNSVTVEITLTTMVDVFCFGPLAIHVVTGKFPDPGPKSVEGKQQTELERRASPIWEITPADRPYMNEIIEHCIKDECTARGTFIDLLRIIENFQDKYHQDANRDKLAAKQMEISKLQAEKEAETRHLKVYLQHTQQLFFVRRVFCNIVQNLLPECCFILE
jgi:serine/threonine protein kinase